VPDLTDGEREPGLAAGSNRWQAARSGRVGSRWVAPLYALTLPGVVLHELAHWFLASVFGLDVKEVDLTSHVIHEAPASFTVAILVAGAPLLVNTLLAVGAVHVVVGTVPFELAALELGWVAPATLLDRGVPYLEAVVAERWLDVLAAYLVFSALFRAMPSTRDVESVFDAARRLSGLTRPHVVVGFLLLAPIRVPLYVGLWLANTTGTRVVVDLADAVLVLAWMTGFLVP
jgi:hypothetical protein